MRSWVGGGARKRRQEGAAVAARSEPAVDPVQRSLVDQVARRGEVRGGVPEPLRSSVEALSGVPLGPVDVHYDSGEPAKVGADAFAAGGDIHLGPGHAGQLPHEVWHVAQQRQGRVPPTLQVGGIGVNVDASLEREADVMGDRARSLASVTARLPGAERAADSRRQLGQPAAAAPVRQFGCGGKKKPWTEQNIGRKNKVHDSRSTFKGHEDALAMGDLVDFEYPVAFDNKQRIVSTETEQIRQWTVTDESFTFYSAVREKSAPLVVQYGLDPSYGGSSEPKGASDWLSRGHIYFGLSKKACSDYASRFIEGGYVMFEFSLPNGTVITQDPEYPQGLRTTAAVPPDKLKRL